MLLPLLSLVLLPLLRLWQICLLSPLLISSCALKERCLGEGMTDLLHLQLILAIVVAALEIVTCKAVYLLINFQIDVILPKVTRP